MQIPVIIEPVANNGFRARSGEPLALTAEASSSAEALEKLRALLEQRLQEGVRVVTLEVPVQESPPLAFKGIFDPDDPLVQEWIDIMAENRREMDEDPEVP